MTFSSFEIAELSKAVKKRISEKRFAHTLGVASMAEKLSALCLPEMSSELVSAAYLHDITKELPTSKHLELIKLQGVALSEEDLNSEAVLHSFSAPFVIKRDFPDFATKDILSAVFNHTLGAPDMSVFDEIIFLADFIEETRPYEESKALRSFVIENMRDGEFELNIRILHEACIKAIDSTVLHLINKKRAINSKNILTRNALLSKI
jgi:predicted HD superfamily hydrolase involved in NAD metabolism